MGNLKGEVLPCASRRHNLPNISQRNATREVYKSKDLCHCLYLLVHQLLHLTITQ